MKEKISLVFVQPSSLGMSTLHTTSRQHSQ